MRPSRLVAVLATVLVAGSAPALSLAPASAAQQAAPDPTVVAIHKQYSRAVHHDGVGPAGVRDTVKYAASVARADGSAIERTVTLTLERRLQGQSAFHAVATSDVPGSEVAVFSTPAERNARYRVSFGGDDALAPSASAAVSLKVMRDFNARKRVKGPRIWMRGNINPGWGGRVVVLQRKACASCAYKPYRRAQAKANGAWKLRAAYPPVGGTWRFRAKIRRSPGFVKSTSAVLVTRTYYARGASSASATLLG